MKYWNWSKFVSFIRSSKSPLKESHYILLTVIDMVSCCYAYDGSQDLTSFSLLIVEFAPFSSIQDFSIDDKYYLPPFWTWKISTEHEFLYLFLYLLLRQLYPSLKLWFRAEAKEKKNKLNAYRHLNLSDANLK